MQRDPEALRVADRHPRSGPRDRRAPRRVLATRPALVTAALAALVPACASPVAPVHGVTLGAPLSADAVDDAAAAIEGLGYRMAWRGGAELLSDWRYDRGLVTLQRHRLLVRVHGAGAEGAAPRVEVQAPREVQRDDGWAFDGEDAEARQLALAALIARLTPPAPPRPLPRGER